MGTSTVAMVGTLTAIAGGLHVSQEAVARLIAAFAITFALAAPAIQVFLGHLPRRSLILAGLLLATLGSLLSAFASGYTTMFVARILTALGSAAIGPVASALGAGLVARERQGRALATVFLGMTMASVLSAPLANWFAAIAGWRAMFVAIAVLNALAGLGILTQVHDRSCGQRMSIAALLHVLRQPRIAAAIGVMLLQMAGVFVSYAMVVPILRDHFGLAANLVPAALMSFGVAGIFGNVLARHLSDRWSADRSVAAALIAMASVFTILYIAPKIVSAAFGVMVLWATANDLFMPAQQRRLIELAPEMRSLVLALNSSALYAGMSVGSFVGGRLAAGFGVAALPVGSALFVAAALLALQASRKAEVPVPVQG
jgi:DHA1 family inner membrane transport protein